jgi:hypothetical protein
MRPCAGNGASGRQPHLTSLPRPLGGVVRPRRAVRFARLIHRCGRVLGGPSAVIKACLAATQGGGMGAGLLPEVIGSASLPAPPHDEAPAGVARRPAPASGGLFARNLCDYDQRRRLTGQPPNLPFRPPRQASTDDLVPGPTAAHAPCLVHGHGRPHATPGDHHHAALCSGLLGRLLWQHLHPRAHRSTRPEWRTRSPSNYKPTTPACA